MVVPSGKRFAFGTKAETLKRIRRLLTLATVPDFHFFSAKAWASDPDAILRAVQSNFASKELAVRSSAVAEDTDVSAMPGVFRSILGVRSDDTTALRSAIDRVVASYEADGGEALENQVLAQCMVHDISMSGVVFTHEMKTGAPYYVINYDDQSGRTDTVTSGGADSNRTLMVFRDSVDELDSERFKALLHAIQEIETVTGCDFLDIEFAVDRDLHVHLLQARKITTRPNWNRGISLRVRDCLHRTRHFVSDRSRPRVGWYGNRSIFAQMTDWNPAEMLGTTPRPLALSLYRRLITDSAWRIARRGMGYAEPKGAALMVSLGGQPFIDARLSFHSYLPAELRPEIAEKLVDAWLDRLSDHDELHDKVEFEVAVTVLAFDFELSVREQFPDALNAEELAEFREALRRLTQDLLLGRTASIEEALAEVERLSAERRRLASAYEDPDPCAIASLLEDCVRFGTIPFSILARHAFVAKSFLRSLIRLRTTTEEEVDAFQRSNKTIATKLVLDLQRTASGTLSKEELLERYGHLRPGAYDILSLRYDQRADLISEASPQASGPVGTEEFCFSKATLRAVQELCDREELGIRSEQLIEYVRSAVTAREFAKFEFTKNLSDALEMIAKWGVHVGLSRDELSYLTIEEILDADIIAAGRTLEQHLRDRSLAAREDHEISQALQLPHVIRSEADVCIVPLLLARPNFITKKSVRGSCVFLDGQAPEIPDISDKIVLIESADPGFDWIFSRPLLGLVTKYGGANSHMAIRCSEFELPAAIGCGEQIFDRVLRASAVEINGSEERILPVGE
jgi:hypothetical protein